MKNPLTILAVLLLSACTQPQGKAAFVLVDKDIEIPIDGCVAGQEKIMGSSVNAEGFCRCLIPKMYEVVKNDPVKLALLKRGQIDAVAKNELESITGFYETCIGENATTDSTSRMNITMKMAAQIKEGMMLNLRETDLAKTNDLDKYCDCIIDGMRIEFSAREIMDENFYESEKYQALGNKCLKASVKK